MTRYRDGWSSIYWHVIIAYYCSIAVTSSVSGEFVNFQTLALYDEFYSFMVGFLVFVGTIQFLKLLQFNQRINLLGDTIKLASKDLKVFSITFFLYFGAFAQAAYLLFGTTLASYNNLIGSAETMFSFALGSFDFYAMVDTQRILGPIFFFAYVGIVSIGLMGIFLTIIAEAFTKVKNDMKLRSNEHEIVDFMWKRFKGLIGVK